MRITPKPPPREPDYISARREMSPASGWASALRVGFVLSIGALGLVIDPIQTAIDREHVDEALTLYLPSNLPGCDFHLSGDRPLLRGDASGGRNDPKLSDRVAARVWRRQSERA